MNPDTIVAIEAPAPPPFWLTYSVGYDLFCLACADKRGLKDDPYGEVSARTWEDLDEAYQAQVYADPAEHYKHYSYHNPKVPDYTDQCVDCGTVVFEAWYAEYDWDFEGEPRYWEYR